jgi:hypothetical protein
VREDDRGRANGVRRGMYIDIYVKARREETTRENKT